MSEISKAEKYLLSRIRSGDSESWSQLVNRYEGRLTHFARARLGSNADCEDIVQETFIAFLKSLPSYRETCSVETYLFTILRRKIIDSYRRKKVRDVSLIQDLLLGDSDRQQSDGFEQLASPQQTASWYVRRDEQQQLHQQALADALSQLINSYKKALNFRDLEIIELLFYCRLPNNAIAKTMNLKDSAVGLIKHRCLAQIREQTAKSKLSAEHLPENLEQLANEIWQQQRLSCPKRSTVGAYLLGTLDADWHGYVDFHLNKLGCHFCRANLEDLKRQSEKGQASRLHARIMESTVGFLRKP
jgi:RNA polymerase sigma factor (sigma-70 family)